MTAALNEAGVGIYTYSIESGGRKHRCIKEGEGKWDAKERESAKPEKKSKD
jgi:hypothetical protein